MSLVFAAITPHPPLLIPNIGKDIIKKLEKTKNALEQLEEDLYVARPEVIFIFSPHTHFFKDAFTINSCAEFESNLKEFGDLITSIKIKGEINLAAHIRSKTKQEHFPATMISEPKLDHGTSVPLFYLTKHLPEVKIIQFGFSDLDPKTHLDFGYLLKDIIMNTNKRVAVIASADLSHALSTEAPAGFSAAGAKFDEKIKELLASHNTAGVLKMDQEIIKQSYECGFRSILIMLGILKNVDYKFKQYAYEAPFGVGYLTANFVI